MAAPAPGGISLAKLPLGGKIGVGVVFGVIVVLVYWVVFFTEVSAKIESANHQSSALEKQLAEAKESQATYLLDRDDLVTRQQHQRELNKILPEDTEAAAFLSSLQQVSNISGVSLRGWQPADEQAQAFFAKVPMKLELSGRFHQIAKFVYEVGRLDRIINVENLDLGEPKLQGDDVVLRARCLATTFHTLKAKATGAPGTPGSKP